MLIQGVNSWDNLIPLHGGIDGPQLAGWTPGSPTKRKLGCVLYADQMIPVEDGVSLAADVYAPKAKGRYPAILVFSAYSKEVQSSGAPTGTNETGSPPVFTNRGYAHVVIARRGMGRSQGESVIFFNDGTVPYAGAPYFSRNTLHYGAESYVELRRVPAQAE